MALPTRVAIWLISISASVAFGVWVSAKAEEGQFGTPKGSEGTRIFKATEHPYYTGQFRLRGQKATLVGGMQDQSPWDHLDYAGKHLNPVQGAIDIDVNEITNTGRVIAEFTEGAARYKVVFDRFSASRPIKFSTKTTRPTSCSWNDRVTRIRMLYATL